MRLFIGISLSQDVKSLLAEAQNRLFRELPLHRPIPFDNLHLTLKFLGECESSKLDAIKDALSRATVEVPAFSMHLSGYGAFPERGPVRILWAAAEGPLVSLHAKIDSELSLIDFERDDRDFHPHVTLFRVKGLSRGDCLRCRELLKDLAIPLVPQSVATIVLFQSVPMPTGTKYIGLEEFSLKGI